MTPRCRGDRGQGAGVEAIPFGLLLFVAGALLIANAWAVIDVKMAVDASARDGARSYVEAPDGASAREVGNRAAVEAIAGHGRDPNRVTISGPLDDAAFTRCNRITYRVSYPVPALTLPFIGGFGDGLTVTSSHSELVDPFRNDVPGEADCG